MERIDQYLTQMFRVYEDLYAGGMGAHEVVLGLRDTLRGFYRDLRQALHNRGESENPDAEARQQLLDALALINGRWATMVAAVIRAVDPEMIEDVGELWAWYEKWFPTHAEFDDLTRDFQAAEPAERLEMLRRYFPQFLREKIFV